MEERLYSYMEWKRGTKAANKHMRKGYYGLFREWESKGKKIKNLITSETVLFP
jgi:hypothetical protein